MKFPLFLKTIFTVYYKAEGKEKTNQVEEEKGKDVI